MQPESGKHRLSPPECVPHGPKTDLEVAQAALPVGIDHPPQALLDHLKAFGNQEKRGGGDHLRAPANLAPGAQVIGPLAALP